MSDLASLLEKVRSAQGPDRALDWHVADATGHESFSRVIEGMWPPFMEGSRADKAVPTYTASIDDALALVERKLPGWRWQISHGFGYEGIVWSAEIEDSAAHWRHESSAPLAILAALLTALITQETPNGN